MNKQKVLEVARRQIGNKEVPPNSNRNKYGAWYGMDRAPWCAMFVSYCFYVAGMPLKITTPKGFAYCPFGVNYFKKIGRWHSSPQVGDVVFFAWGRRDLAQHVGIVERVRDDGSITTIEGNTSPSNDANGGMVMRRTRYPKVIMGYGRPDYSQDAEPNPTNAKHPSWQGRYITLASPHMEGEDIKIWQQQMIKRGWDLGEAGADGVFGAKSHMTLVEFQKEKGLEADGTIGPLSWNAAFELPITSD